ncbi:hypothetical protein JZ751_007042 [Albula glossodonta]|uniref:Uncharacterized protein n=1 Tax=Albula glossodonta TaxID=121402 RepID=A0A8T2PB39_9TELE|nr:hypothetical protein JZ751_007042 [Albula glossodonta]
MGSETLWRQDFVECGAITHWQHVSTEREGGKERRKTYSHSSIGHITGVQRSGDSVLSFKKSESPSTTSPQKQIVKSRSKSTEEIQQAKKEAPEGSDTPVSLSEELK